MLFFLLFRFEENDIEFNKLKLKLTVRSDLHKKQMDELGKGKYLKIRQYLSATQRSNYDSYFGVLK